MKKKFKSLLSFALAFTILFSSLSAFALDITYGEKLPHPELKLPIDESKLLVNGTIVFEAEDILIENDNNAYAFTDKTASGDAAVSMRSTKWTIGETKGDELYTKFYLDDPALAGTYKMFMRFKNASSDSPSAWIDPGTGVFAAKWFSDNRDSYKWTSMNIMVNEGENYIAFRTRTRVYFDKIIITNDLTFSPTADGVDPKTAVPVYKTEEEKIEEMKALWAEPEIKPIEGHPRLLITKANRDKIKTEIKNTPKWETINKWGDSNVAAKLDTTKANNHNATVLSRIMARALVWVLGERTDPAHAKQTINHMKDYIETVRTPDDQGDISRSRGNILYTAAMVYDWCYDQLTPEDKEYFVEKIMKLVASKEIGWPPKIQGNLASHAGEQEIFRDLLGAGIAIYDEYPLLYDVSAGRMFQEMVPGRKYLRQAGRVEYGHDYSLSRGYSEVWADWQIQAMGYPSIYGEELATRMWQWRIDARMPYGTMFPDGDMYSTGTRSVYRYYYVDYYLALAIASTLYNDPVLYQEFQRYATLWSSSDYDEVFLSIILAGRDKNLKAEVWDERSLTNLATYPQSGFVARTNWQEGFDSDAAAAFVDMHELYVGDHQMEYTGDFQVYYKGLLAMNTGTYNTSNQHNAGYSHRSIAANVLLVHDPDETFDSYWQPDTLKVGNDGGQRTPNNNLPYGVLSLGDYNIEDGKATNEQYIVSRDVKTYAGPNKETPEFTYITGDLTNAYTAKVTDYHRSMVFMDLNDEEYPAAFIVYDKIDSSNPEFKKTFLLHSQEEPEIKGNTTIIERTENGFGGRLVNKTLNPSVGNLEINVVGGNNGEMFKTEAGANSVNENRIEAGKYRIEISPTNKAKSHQLLNAMYVTDAGNTKELPMKQISYGNFTGVMVKDKQVYFSKYADTISEKFSMNFRSNGYGENSILIGNIAPGVWTVSGGGKTQNIEVTADSGALVFKGAPGMYTITPAAEGTKADEIIYPKTEKKEVGDFYVWHDDETSTTANRSNYIYLKNPTRLIGGAAYVSAETLATLGINIAINGSTATIVSGENTITLTAGSSAYMLSGAANSLANAPQMIDGVLYICPTEIADILGYKITYHNEGNVLWVGKINE